MKDIRREALCLWMFVVLAGAVLLPGCGNSYSEEPLLTFDSPEMQELQKEIETEASDAADVADNAEMEAGTSTVTAEENGPQDNQADASPADNDVEQTAVTTQDSADPKSADVKPAIFPGEEKNALSPQKPREVKLLVPEKKFLAEGKGPDRALRVSYDDLDLLKVLNMDPVSLDAPEKMPDWLKGLDGKRIRLRGFMYPPDSETGISVFVLARDNQICCFGRNPKPYDVIHIVMRKGQTVDYILGRPFDVVGNFHIEMLSYDDKKVDGLYYLDDSLVIDR